MTLASSFGNPPSRIIKFAVVTLSVVISSAIHSHAIELKLSPAWSIVHFAAMWSVGWAAVGFAVKGARGAGQGFLNGIFFGALGYGLAQIFVAMLWLFGLYLWWLFMWCCLGLYRAFLLEEKPTHGLLRGFAGFVLSAFPLSAGIVLWFEPSSSKGGNGPQLFLWWGLSFALGYLAILFNRKHLPPDAPNAAPV